MLNKITWQQRVFEVFNSLLMVFLMITMFYPLWYVFCASLSNSNELLAHQGMLFLPIKPTFAAYQNAFKHPLLVNSYINTLFVVVVGTTLSTDFYDVFQRRTGSFLSGRKESGIAG